MRTRARVRARVRAGENEDGARTRAEDSARRARTRTAYMSWAETGGCSLINSKGGGSTSAGLAGSAGAAAPGSVFFSSLVGAAGADACNAETKVDN